MLTNDLLLKAADIGFIDAIRSSLDQQQSTTNFNISYQHPHDSSSGYNKGVNALMLAARSGHEELVQWLLSLKTKAESKTNSINNNDDDDNNQQEETFLLDPCQQDAEIWTSLHYAAFCGHHRVCKHLLDSPKMNSKENLSLITMFEKATPQGFAEHRKFKESVRVLTCGEKNVDGNKLFEWTEEERVSNLDRCLKKLRKSCPLLSHQAQTQKHIPKRAQQNQNTSTSVVAGNFLFRYEMTLENYKKLEQHLDSQKEGKPGTGKCFVVLDAVDLLLHKENDVPILKSLEEEGRRKVSSNEPSIELRALLSIFFTYEYGKSEHAQNSKHLPVRLIIHSNFEEHQRIADMLFGFQKTEAGMKMGMRILRSSSINGLEHVIVVALI